MDINDIASDLEQHQTEQALLRQKDKQTNKLTPNGECYNQKCAEELSHNGLFCNSKCANEYSRSC